MPPISPHVVERSDQPYVAIRRTVTMSTMGSIADRIPELFSWLGQHEIQPAGAPFLRYNVIDMQRELEVEAGVPVHTDVAGEGDVFSAVVPAGRYVTVSHIGPYDELIGVTAALLDWAAERRLVWDASERGDGTVWGCRLETYKTNPADEPDFSKHEVELAIRLADG